MTNFHDFIRAHESQRLGAPYNSAALFSYAKIEKNHLTRVTQDLTKLTKYA